MNGTVVAIIVMFLLMWGCATCMTPRRQATTTSTDTTINVISSASDGLDLKALGQLVSEVSSAEDLERKINKPNSINNLDLDDDGQVDFISVTEYGNKTDEFGFSLTAEPAKGEVQEVATIEVIKEEQRATLQVHGNQHIYGSGHHYSAGYTIGGLLLMSYLLRPHPFYMPTYGFGRYPGYYSSYSTVHRGSYQSRVSGMGSSVSRASASNVKSTSITNPNKGKVAQSGIKKSLAKPTASQKSFQARNASKSVGKGGFGKSGKTVRGRSSSRSSGSRGK